MEPTSQAAAAEDEEKTAEDDEEDDENVVKDAFCLPAESPPVTCSAPKACAFDAGEGSEGGGEDIAKGNESRPQEKYCSQIGTS